MALSGSESRDYQELYDLRELAQKGSTTIYMGSLVVAAADGYSKPGLTATGLVVQGVAVEDSVNSGADGAKKVKVTGSTIAANGRKRLFAFSNAAGGDAITIADMDRDVYIYDDDTFTTTSSGRSVGGKFRGFELDKSGAATGRVLIELPI